MEQDAKDEISKLEIEKKRKDPEQEKISDSEIEVESNKENKRRLPEKPNDDDNSEDELAESTKNKSRTDEIEKKSITSKISSMSSKLKRKNKKLKQKIQFKESDLKKSENEPRSISTSTNVKMSSSDHLSDASNIPSTESQTFSNDNKLKNNNERDETKRSNISLFSKIKVPKVQVKNLKKLGKIKRKSNKGSEITEPEINENEIENGDENSLEEEAYDSDDYSDTYEEQAKPVRYGPSDIEHVTNDSTNLSNTENEQVNDRKKAIKIKRKRNKKKRDSRSLPEDLEVISSQEISSKREKRVSSQSKEETEAMSTETDKSTWEKILMKLSCLELLFTAVNIFNRI